MTGIVDRLIARAEQSVVRASGYVADGNHCAAAIEFRSAAESYASAAAGADDPQWCRDRQAKFLRLAHEHAALLPRA